MSAIPRRSELAESRLQNYRTVALRGSAPWILIVVGLIAAAFVGAAIPEIGVLAPVAAVGLVVGALAFVYPSFGVFCFILLLFIRAPEILPGTPGSSTATVAGAIFLLTALVMKEGFAVFRTPRSEEWQPLALYGLALAVSVFVAVEPFEAVDAVVTYGANVIAVGIIAISARRATDLRLMSWAFILAGTIPALITIYQVLSGSTNEFFGFGQLSEQVVVPGERTQVLRPSGPVGDPNFYAMILIALIPLALHRLRYEHSLWLRVAAFTSLAAVSVAAFTTYSRGGYVAIAAVLVSAAIVGLLRFRALAVLGFALLLALPLLPPSYYARAAGIVETAPVVLGIAEPPNSPVRDQSISGRTSEVMAGVHMFVDRPILGVGADNYPAYYQEYARPMEILTRDARAAHSLYIEIAAETGIVGIATFGILVVSLFWWLWRDWRLTDRPDELRDFSRAVAVALVGLLVASIFLHAAYPRYLWLFVALALATHSISRGFPVISATEAHRTADAYRVTPGIRPSAAAVLARAGWATGGLLVVVAFFATFGMSSAWVRASALPSVASTEPPAAVAANPTATNAAEPADAAGPPTVAPSETTAPASTPEPTATTGQAVPVAPVAPTPTVVPDSPATPTADIPAAAQNPAIRIANCLYFPEVDHNVCEPFSTYWEQNGDIVTLGYPITEAFEVDGRLIQYFERARLEVDTANGDPEGDVVRAPLGVDLLAELPDDVQEPAEPRPEVTCQFVEETGHNLCGLFLGYWSTFGGEAAFGQPVTESFLEAGVLVQYFELARLEWHPGEWPERDDVLLGRIGVEALALELER